MVVLPSTGALRYHNCCVDGTSLENFGYHPVYTSGTEIQVKRVLLFNLHYSLILVTDHYLI
jgi:hypothetical protein